MDWALGILRGAVAAPGRVRAARRLLRDQTHWREEVQVPSMHGEFFRRNLSNSNLIFFILFIFYYYILHYNYYYYFIILLLYIFVYYYYYYFETPAG